jgi:hypothetical protein
MKYLLLIASVLVIGCKTAKPISREEMICPLGPGPLPTWNKDNIIDTLLVGILDSMLAKNWVSYPIGTIESTTIQGVGIISLPQYDTVDVICLVSDTASNDSMSVTTWAKGGGGFIMTNSGALWFSQTIAIKAKAVRECTEVRQYNSSGLLWVCEWSIIKYIGIPSKYIIWQTKILK